MATNTPKKVAVMSYSPSSFLTVRVGIENPQEFLLHEAMVCASSKFFRRAMNGDWAEKAQRLVKLPEDDQKIFALYVNIVCTNEIIIGSAFDQDYPNHQYRIFSLVKLYVFAEKVQDKEAKNKTIETLLHCITKHSPVFAVDKDVKGFLPNAVAVQLMYENSLEGSCGRRLMADLWCDARTDILNESEGICKDFFVDLIRTFHKQHPSVKKNVALTSSIKEYLEV